MARTREVYPTGEIPHLWAVKSQDSARNPQGNLYFRDSTIFSYRDSFPIARHVVHNGNAAVLFTAQDYSVTTSRHKAMVRRACSHIPTFTVGDVFAIPTDISKQKGKVVTDLIAKLELAAVPAKSYPSLKSGEIELTLRGRFSEPDTTTKLPALNGTNLCLHKTTETSSSYTVTHIISRLAVASGITRPQAREIISLLDRNIAWKRIGADGAIPQDIQGKLRQAVSVARTKASKVTGVNRHPSAITNLWRSLESAIENVNAFNSFFGFKTRYSIPASIQALGAKVTEYETTRQTRREALQAVHRERRRLEHEAWIAAEPERARAEELRRAQRELERAERAAKLPQALEGWKSGSPSSYDFYDLPPALRIKGSEVETSHGARFPVAHAALGLRIVRKVVESGQPYQRNGHTVHLGHYAIDRIDTDGTVHAGCHHVPYAEIQRIAPEIEAAVKNLATGSESGASDRV